MEWMRDKAKREPSQPPPSASPSEGWNQVVSDLYDASNGGDGENGDLSDVTFVLTEEDGTEVKFAAHRLLLSLRSPVFRAMFHGPLRDDSGLVRVEDVSPKAFETMITYMYKGEDNAGASSWMATPANAWQLWYAAKKYMLDSLEEKCRKVRKLLKIYCSNTCYAQRKSIGIFQYLKAHLTPLNVLDTYSFAERYGDPQVLYQCLRLIDRHARYILASPGFTCLPLRLARSILERRTLSAREVDVFEAAVRWVQSELARRMSDGSEGAVPSTAQIFREDFQGLVRFDQFSSEVGIAEGAAGGWVGRNLSRSEKLCAKFHFAFRSLSTKCCPRASSIRTRSAGWPRTSKQRSVRRRRWRRWRHLCPLPLPTQSLPSRRRRRRWQHRDSLPSLRRKGNRRAGRG